MIDSILTKQERYFINSITKGLYKDLSILKSQLGLLYNSGTMTNNAKAMTESVLAKVMEAEATQFFTELLEDDEKAQKD